MTASPHGDTSSDRERVSGLLDFKICVCNLAAFQETEFYHRCRGLQHSLQDTASSSERVCSVWSQIVLFDGVQARLGPRQWVNRDGVTVTVTGLGHLGVTVKLLAFWQPESC